MKAKKWLKYGIISELIIVNDINVSFIVTLAQDFVAAKVSIAKFLNI